MRFDEIALHCMRIKQRCRCAPSAARQGREEGRRYFVVGVIIEFSGVGKAFVGLYAAVEDQYRRLVGILGWVFERGTPNDDRRAPCKGRRGLHIIIIIILLSHGGR